MPRGLGVNLLYIHIKYITNLTLGLICFTTGKIFIISPLEKAALFLLSKSYSRSMICKPIFNAKDLKKVTDIIEHPFIIRKDVYFQSFHSCTAWDFTHPRTRINCSVVWIKDDRICLTVYPITSPITFWYKDIAEKLFLKNRKRSNIVAVICRAGKTVTVFL